MEVKGEVGEKGIGAWLLLQILLIRHFPQKTSVSQGKKDSYAAGCWPVLRNLRSVTWQTHWKSHRISCNWEKTEVLRGSGREGGLCLGRTCTASTERTPFSQAFSTSRMAAGMLRQISCHFTWLSHHTHVKMRSIWWRTYSTTQTTMKRNIIIFKNKKCQVSSLQKFVRNICKLQLN